MICHNSVIDPENAIAEFCLGLIAEDFVSFSDGSPMPRNLVPVPAGDQLDAGFVFGDGIHHGGDVGHFGLCLQLQN